MLSVEYRIVFAFSSQADRSWASVICCVGLMGPEEIAGVQLMCWAFSRKGTKPLQVGRPRVTCQISHSGGVSAAATTSLFRAGLVQRMGVGGARGRDSPVTLSLRLDQGTG